MEYRRDIDGLRSLAVLLVIFNHAGFSGLSGGYVGVDVFFVISGYLITSIIAASIHKQSFSFSGFLARRIKRLMPVLFVVIFFTTLVFSWVLLPQDLSKYYRSIIWVVLYGGNFFFWREHGGYFDGGSQEAPLLHTWSLAVEEQYYLVWPLALMLLLKFLGKKVTVYVVGVGCIAATVFSQWGTEVTIGAAYYLLPTRFFELMVGSWLALAWYHLPVLNNTVRSGLSLLGLGLIVGSAVMLTEHSPFPGYNALYSVLGTALIIYASVGVVNKGFALRPFVFIGNLSYSMYLWHWPIFVFARYTAIEFTLLTQIICIALTLFLSLLSWKYVEQPLRRKKVTSFAPIANNMFIKPALVLILFAFVGIMNDGFPGRFSASILEMDQALNSHASESRKGCHSPYRESSSPPKADCLFGDTLSGQQTPKVFLFGDSHANHIVPFLDTLLSDAQLVGQDYTLDQCLPVFDLKWGGNLHKAKQCQGRNKLADEFIANNSFDYIVLAASWPGAKTKRLFLDERISDSDVKEKLLLEKLLHTVDKIILSGATPVMIEDIHYLNGKDPKCPIKKQLFSSSLDCRVNQEPNVFFSGLVSSVKSMYPQVIVIKPRDLICKGSSCTMFAGGIPLFRDDDHLNEMGSKLMGELYLNAHDNPFLLRQN